MRAHKLIPLIAAAALFTGCAANTSTTTDAEPAATVADNCLELNTASIDALDAGITDPAVKLGQYAAVPSPEGTNLWYVAATYTADDLNGEAVWITQYDPTNSDDNAYLSVDAVAETISNYNRLEGADITAPGAVEATNCLDFTSIFTPGSVGVKIRRAADMADRETIPLNPDLAYASKATAQRQADAWNEVLGQSVINREPATTVVVGPRTGGKYPLVWEVKGEQ